MMVSESLSATSLDRSLSASREAMIRLKFCFSEPSASSRVEFWDFSDSYSAASSSVSSRCLSSWVWRSLFSPEMKFEN